jgi:hypothetical protein
MTLSSSKLNEIAALYENIAASEQEVLNEIGVNFGGQKAVDAVKQRASNASAFNSKLDALRNQRFGGSKLTLNKPESGATPGRGFAGGHVTGGSTPAARPASSTTPSRSSAPASSDKPAASAKVTPTKPAGSAMDQWAKANPKLAAAKAERDRTRGTSATTNPLMKDMKSSLPAPAPKSAPPSSTLKSATTAASKPSAFKPATTAVASSTTDKGAVPATNAIAAAPKPKPMVPTRMPLAQSFEYDAYDLVLEYLLSQGHAETVAEAQYLMTEMDAEMIGGIVEGIADRTANAVGHQRAGTLGDDDEMRKNQDATSASIGKMKRGSGAKVTPTLPGV